MHKSQTYIFILCFLFSINLKAEDSSLNSKQFPDGSIVKFQENKLILEKNNKLLSSLVFEIENNQQTELSLHNLGQDTFALNLYIQSRNSSRRIIALRKGDSSKLNLIIDENETYKGDLGEQTATRYMFVKSPDNNTFELIKGTVCQRTYLCGIDEPAFIFPQKYDLNKRTFIPTSLNRFANRDLQVLPGYNTDLKAEPDKIQFLIPKAVSSEQDNEFMPIFLTPPFSMIDNNSNSFWSPGWLDGHGEFATFSTISSSYSISSIGIEVFSEASTKDCENISLIISATNNTFKVKASLNSKTWFDFPEPIKSKCLSLVIEKTNPSNKCSPIKINQVNLKTQLDGQEGIIRLVENLAHDKTGEQSVILLRAVGEEAFLHIEKRWDLLKKKGKRRAIRLIADISPQKGASILAEAAIKGEPFIAEPAIQGLLQAKEHGIDALKKYINNPHEKNRQLALDIIVQIGGKKAIEAISEVAGLGTRKQRRVLQETLFELTSLPQTAGLLIDEAQNRLSKNEHIAVYDLLNVAIQKKETHEAACEMALKAYKETDVFANRYRYLQVISHSQKTEAKELILKSASDKNVHIREMAMRSLYIGLPDQKNRKALLKGLKDNAPQVRATALALLSKTQKGDDFFEDIENLSNDHWPHVRTVAINSADLLPDSQKVEFLIKAMQDESTTVVMAALKKIVQMPWNLKIQKALIKILADQGINNRIIFLATTIAGKECYKDKAMVPVLVNLLEKGAQPLASSAQIQIGIEAASALSRIGSQEAKKALEKASALSNPTMDEAISSVLKTFGKECKNQTTP
jgi:HEAT repeat protein